MVWALRQRLITALIGSNTEAEAEYALDSLPPRLALFFAFPRVSIFPRYYFTTNFPTHKKVHLRVVGVLAGAGKLRDSPAAHAPTLLLSVPHLVRRAHNPADDAPPSKSRAAQSNHQQLGIHEQQLFFEAPRTLRCNNALFI